MPSDPFGQQNPYGPGPYQQQGQYMGSYGTYQAQPYTQPDFTQPNFTQQPYYPGAGTGYPQSPPQQPRAKRGKKLAFIIAGGSTAVVAIAAFLVLGFITPGFLTSTQISATSVQAGIKQVIEKDYELTGYGAVSCPEPLPTTKGARMTCTVEYNGATMPVLVESRGDSGKYFVYPPGHKPGDL